MAKLHTIAAPQEHIGMGTPAMRFSNLGRANVLLDTRSEEFSSKKMDNPALPGLFRRLIIPALYARHVSHS